MERCFRPANTLLWHSRMYPNGSSEPLTFAVGNFPCDEKTAPFLQGGRFKLQLSGFAVSARTFPQPEGTSDEPPASADTDLFLRSAVCSDHPAMAVFRSVIEEKTTVNTSYIGKIYRLLLRSGPADVPDTLRWTLYVPQNRLRPAKAPRVGDLVVGQAVLYGEISGRRLSEPDYSDNLCALLSLPSPLWQPNCTQVPFPIHDYGGCIEEESRCERPHFLLYAEYCRRLPRKPVLAPPPQNAELQDIFTQLQQVIPTRKAFIRTAFTPEAAELKRNLQDPATDYRFLWFTLPRVRDGSRLEAPVHLFVNTDPSGRLLNYTLYDGFVRPSPRLDVSRFICYNNRKPSIYLDDTETFIRELYTLEKDEFFILSYRGHSSYLQAACDGTDDRGTPIFQTEWQILDIPWHYGILDCTPDGLAVLIRAFLSQGVTAVQTMAEWNLCLL